MIAVALPIRGSGARVTDDAGEDGKASTWDMGSDPLSKSATEISFRSDTSSGVGT
jgi:hypothetical protein